MSTPLASGSITYVDGVMACPLCGEGDGTHVDHVYVGARHEDQDFVYTHVDAIEGTVEPANSATTPTGPRVKEGRRHRIALTGWCEHCDGEYAIVFTQHKGATLIETVRID